MISMPRMRLFYRIYFVLLTLAVACLGPVTARAHSASGFNNAVATVHPLATDAAMQVYRDGGNAIDAAIAAALTLSVVDNHNSGIGGGCLILVRKPDGSFLAIDGRETAPAAATSDMFVIEGRLETEASKTGPLASGVPGALAAYEKLRSTVGSLPLERLLQPGMKAAEEGFSINRSYASRLAARAGTIAKYEGSRTQLLKPDGKPYQQGEVLKQPDLARTYAKIAEQGIDYFYRGEFAQRVGNWMSENGGILTAADFAAYEAKVREPLRSTYRGREIIGFPPPSSGGIHVAQMLNILENFDLGAIHRRDAEQARHVIIEAMKLAFADRAYWLGDADYADVPRGLTTKAYAKELASKISLTSPTIVSQHGTPRGWRSDLFGRHTTHIATADANGYWVAITATVNTGFGSKVIVPGTGVVLNNEMDDFSIKPGVPNAFGLIGAENNAIEPGKRPLSSMSPTIMLDADGKPLLAIGAAGGPKIITQVLLGIVRTIDYGMTLEEAVASPRFHHQWRPDTVGIEPRFTDAGEQAIKALGHPVERLSSGGVTQAITHNEDTGFFAVADPRMEGKAAAE